MLEAIEDAGFEGELLQEADSNSVTLRVEGMTCSSCSLAVETALRSQKGVVSASVNLLAKQAEVHLPTRTKSMAHCLLLLDVDVTVDTPGGACMQTALLLTLIVQQNSCS